MANLDKLIQEIELEIPSRAQGLPACSRDSGPDHWTAGRYWRFLEHIQGRRFRRRGCFLVRRNRHRAAFGARGRADARLRRC